MKGGCSLQQHQEKLGVGSGRRRHRGRGAAGGRAALAGPTPGSGPAGRSLSLGPAATETSPGTGFGRRFSSGKYRSATQHTPGSPLPPPGDPHPGRAQGGLGARPGPRPTPHRRRRGPLLPALLRISPLLPAPLSVSPLPSTAPAGPRSAPPPSASQRPAASLTERRQGPARLAAQKFPSETNRAAAPYLNTPQLHRGAGEPPRRRLSPRSGPRPLCVPARRSRRRSRPAEEIGSSGRLPGPAALPGTARRAAPGPFPAPPAGRCGRRPR